MCLVFGGQNRNTFPAVLVLNQHAADEEQCMRSFDPHRKEMNRKLMSVLNSIAVITVEPAVQRFSRESEAFGSSF